MAQLHKSVLDFTFTYFNWWPSIVCHILTLIVYHITRGVFSDESAKVLVGNFFILACYSIIILLTLHLMVSRVGVASSNTAALNSKIDPAIEGNILDHL